MSSFCLASRLMLLIFCVVEMVWVVGVATPQRLPAHSSAGVKMLVVERYRGLARR